MEKREVEKLLKEHLPNKSIPERRDIRRVIEDNLPHTSVKGWNEGNVILNVNESKLRRETIKNQEILMTGVVKANEREFVICKSRAVNIMIVQ